MQRIPIVLPTSKDIKLKSSPEGERFPPDIYINKSSVHAGVLSCSRIPIALPRVDCFVTLMTRGKLQGNKKPRR